MAEFETPPAGGNTDRAVLDPEPGPATLSSLDEASEEDRDEVLGGSVATDAPADKEQPDTIFDQMCPMCGWKQDNRDIIKITDKDKTNFVLAALGNKRFHRNYKQFGGRLKIVMRSRLYAETEMIGRQIRRWRKKEKIEASNMMFIKNEIYNMIVGLESVQVEDQEPVEYPEIAVEISDSLEADSPLEMAEERLREEWSETIYSVIQNVSRHFDQVVQHLTLRAHDPDFWPRTATPA